MNKENNENRGNKDKPFKNKELIIVLMMVFFLVLLYLLFNAFSKGGDIKTSDKPTSAVYFNEIMTNNASYPDGRGIICDWAELYNSSNKDVDISGYVVYDEQRGEKLVIPQGTVLEANGYLLISFGGGEGDFTALFALNKKGNETLILSNALDMIIDNAAIGRLDTDTVMVRDKYGSWAISVAPTPLYENDYEKFADYIAKRQAQPSSLLITEVMSSNLGRVADDQGQHSDWIEITNVSDEAINLSGFFLSDDFTNIYKSPLPDKTIIAGESIVVFATGKIYESSIFSYADFKISSQGETIVLCDWRGILYSKVDVPRMPDNYSYARGDDGTFMVSPVQTPELANDQVSETAGKYAHILISEVCPNNQSGIRDAEGDFGDWIEIANRGDNPVELNDLWLSVDDSSVYEYNLPGITLDAKEQIIIFADNKEMVGDEIHANFSLSAYGESISLHTFDGYLIDSFQYEKADDDMSYTHENKSEVVTKSGYITPWQANTMDGRIEYMQTISSNSSLLINEVMTSNSTLLPLEYGEKYDWVEIINNSNSPINLGEYFITDDMNYVQKTALPNIVLQPNEMFIVMCSGDADKTNNKAFHADFALPAAYSPLYLTDSIGELVDWMTLYSIPPDTSYGRMPNQSGFYHFVHPTPSEQNADGARGVSIEPQLLVEGGIYQTGDEGLTIQMYAEGDIYYTTDGTVPDENSTGYAEPIVLTNTSVIRAITIESDMLVSKVATTSYFLNVEHELPILSLSVNPEDMFNHYIGIYVKGVSQLGNYYKNWEKLANLTLYDTDGNGFSIDCGLKMHGGGSRRSDEKKSLKVIFRPKYGQSSITYDLFGEHTPNEFTSLVLRAGEDYRYTLFRSELVTGLAKQADPNALTQAHKYCVMYVNGEYFGIFALMERYNEEYYAARYNVSPESVNIVGTIDVENSKFYDLIEFCKVNDMRKKENYDYIAEHVDIDILIDWIIFQSYSGNTDIPYNVRIINSSEGDSKWRYCFYDLDWTFRSQTPTFASVFGQRNLIFALPNYLLQNDEFKAQLIGRAQVLRYGVLSNENVLKQMEEYDQLLSKELPMDRKKWHVAMYLYDTRLETLKATVRDVDRWESLMESLYAYCGE